MAGITITADSGTQFEAGAAEHNSIDRLTDDSYVIAYRDNNDYNYGKVNVGSRTGTSVTINEANAVTFNSDDTDLITVRMMSSTKIVISYRDVNSGKGYVICGTISGTTITLGAAVTDGVAQVYSVSVAVLDDTNFVYSRAYSWAFSWVCSVSGTTITMGNYMTIATSNSYRLNTIGLDSTHYAILHTGWTLYITVGLVNVGAKTITFGAISASMGTVTAEQTDFFIDKFDSTHIIEGHIVDANNTVNFNACSINLSTLAVTVGDAMATGGLGTVSNASMCAINAYSFLVSYYTTTSTQGEIRSGTLTGDTTIAWDAQGAQIFDNGTSAYTSLCRLTDDYFILGYKSG